MDIGTRKPPGPLLPPRPPCARLPRQQLCARVEGSEMAGPNLSRVARRARATAYRRYVLGRSPRKAALLRALKRQQWLSPAELRPLQDARLRGLVQYAYAHVPYYRQVLDEC